MSKYRIVKSEIKYKNDKTEIVYNIQRKLFWIWWRAGVKTNYHCVVEWNHKPHDMAFLTVRYWDFNSLEDAQKVLNHLQNPYEEIFNGGFIIRVLNDQLRDVYINLAHTTRYLDNIGYEYDYSLEGLQEKILSRKSKITKTIITH